MRVLVAYLDISDSKEAERTHQKEMGKVQEYIRHIRQKTCVSKLQNSDNSSQGYKKKTIIMRLASLYKKVDMDVN